MRIVPSLACLSLLAVLATEARADEIVLKNGDKITGKVVDMAGGKLKVETAHSGVVTVDFAQVATLKTDGPIKVKTTGGEVFEGKVTSGPDGKILVEAPGVAAREVHVSQIKFFNEPPAVWHGGFTLAARTSDGNTHTTSMLLSLDMGRESEIDRITMKAIFRYGKTKDVLTERNSYGIAKYDYFLSERLFAFALAEFLGDRFKDLRLRTTIAAGLGTIIIKEPNTDLWGDIGPAHVHNDFVDGDDESHAAIRIGGHLRQALPLNLELTDDVVFTPNVEEGDDWTLRNDLAVSAALGVGWAFKTGVITDYDNDPPDGVRKHDNTYYVGIGYKF